MSRDPLLGGSDPLGVDPIAHVERIKQSKLQRSIEAFRNNILLRGTTMIDRDNPSAAPGVIGDDGETLTEEKRRELAATRTPYDPEMFGKKEPVLGYDQDLKDHVTEQIGETVERILQTQPEMQVIRPKELVIDPKEAK